MRRFILTYRRKDHSISELTAAKIEGIQFSSEAVVLEFYPDDDWVGVRSFHNLRYMEFKLNEFGETSIKWLDEAEVNV